MGRGKISSAATVKYIPGGITTSQDPKFQSNTKPVI